MPNDGKWYEVVRGSELMQGDLLNNCPVARVRGFEQWPLPVGQSVEVEVYLEDLVVLSQSCDLANEKIQDVILAQMLDWQIACDELVQQGNLFARSKQFRKARECQIFCVNGFLGRPSCAPLSKG